MHIRQPVRQVLIRALEGIALIAVLFALPAVAQAGWTTKTTRAAFDAHHLRGRVHHVRNRAKLVRGPIATYTFGNATVGGTYGGGFLSDRKRVNRYSLSQAGLVSKLSVYLQSTAVSGTQTLKGVVYADSGGSPGALLATSQQVTFSHGQSSGWYEMSFASPVSLPTGTYWVGILSGATAGVAGYRYDSVSGSRGVNANTYTSGPSASFGSYSRDNEQMSLYASYTPASPPASTAPPSYTWSGTYNNCGSSSLYPYRSPGPNGWITCKPDPAGSGQQVLDMNVCGTCYAWANQPRADWRGPSRWGSGSDFYVSIPIYIPNGTSVGTTTHAGAMFFEMYGAPYNISPSNSLDVVYDGSGLRFSEGGNMCGKPGGGCPGDGGLWWDPSGHVTTNQWHTFIEHFVMSTNPSLGTFELWKDGVKQTLNGTGCQSPVTGCGTTTVHFATIIPGATDGEPNQANEPTINNYRAALSWGGTIDLIHGAPAIGPTYSSVYNTLANAPFGP